MTFQRILKRKKVYLFMALWAILLGCMPQVSFAMPVGSQPAALSDREADIKAVRSILEREEVRSRLSKLGLTPAEITDRLSRLDDARLHLLAKRLDSVKAGSGAGVVVAIVVVALVIIAILYFTDRAIRVEKRH